MNKSVKSINPREAVFTKIRHKSKKTVLEFDILNDHYVFTCEDPVHADFRRAWEALGPDVAAILEVNRPATWQAENPVLPYQVTITRKADQRTFKITAERALARHEEALTLNCPPVQDDGIEPGRVLNESTVAKLDTLIEEARLYLAGKRSQPDMFGSGDASGEGEPSAEVAALAEAGAQAGAESEEASYQWGDEPPPPGDSEARLTYYEALLEEVAASREEGTSEAGDERLARITDLQGRFRRWRDGYGVSLDGKGFERTQALSKRMAELKREAEALPRPDLEEAAA
ncbi:MAG: hypothetical protein R3247_01400 [Rhodothermales bacterium]|nr:hypothetical protein [Rhodothermales bacterium]